MNKRRSTTWTLDALLGSLCPDVPPAIALTGVCLDSRLVQRGDIYLAVAGATTHGMCFAHKAVAAGAVAVLTTPDAMAEHADVVDELQQCDVPVFGIADLNVHCATIAARFYGEPDQDLTLIAVTGTDGKTSVCRFIAQALSSVDQPCGYIGTLGWGMGDHLQATELTTPDAVTLRRLLADMKEQGARCVVLEASSHGLATGRLTGLALDIAVLTNVGRDHLDFHKTEQAYHDAKAQLFSWPRLNAVVLNGCDALGQRLLSASKQTLQYAYFPDNTAAVAVNDQTVNVQRVEADAIAMHNSGLQFSIVDGGESALINSPLLGRFNVDNLLACYCSLRAYGLAANEACHALSAVKPVPGRMERYGGEDVPTVVIDFAHTPQALSVAIAAVRVHCQGQLWVVFGCGGDRDRGKRAPMAAAAEAGDRILLTDDNPRTERSEDIIADALTGFSDTSKVLVINDRARAIAHAITHAASSDLILVAGKGHEQFQIIGATRHRFSDRDEVLAALEQAS